jgi:ubiquinone/menaquinone biosynthesis C-methylase UbiE
VPELPPNHHAHYRQFGGLFGYLAALTMVAGRGGDARLVADMAGVSPTDRVLDIGCGPGTAARHAAGRGADVIGLDPSPPMLRMARLLSTGRSLPGAVAWRQSTAEHMDVPDDSITVCWSLASVHHWQDLGAGLDEVERVLAGGGRFLALEKLSPPEATGLSSHGWTTAQADRFASMLTDRGYRDVDVSTHNVGRREIVVVRGTWPAGASNG